MFLLLLLLLSMMKVMRGRRNRQKTRAQTRKSLSLFLSFSRVVVVNNSVVLSSRLEMMMMQWKQRTNERKFKITRSLSPSKRHNKSTVTEEEDKKKRQQVPLSLSNFSLSLFCSACFCVRCIYKITSQNTKRLKTKEIYITSVCVNVSQNL